MKLIVGYTLYTLYSLLAILYLMHIVCGCVYSVYQVCGYFICNLFTTESSQPHKWLMKLQARNMIISVSSTFYILHTIEAIENVRSIRFCSHCRFVRLTLK